LWETRNKEKPRQKNCLVMCVSPFIYRHGLKNFFSWSRSHVEKICISIVYVFSVTHLSYIPIEIFVETNYHYFRNVEIEEDKITALLKLIEVLRYAGVNWLLILGKRYMKKKKKRNRRSFSNVLYTRYEKKITRWIFAHENEIPYVFLWRQYGNIIHVASLPAKITNMSPSARHLFFPVYVFVADFVEA
jgi:hypothetical protein